MESEKAVLDEYEFDLEQAAETANCQDNWSLVLRQRLKDKAVIERWFDYRKKFFVTPEGQNILREAHEEFSGVVDRVFNKTGVSLSSDLSRKDGTNYQPHNTGVGKYLEPGVVFFDATDLNGAPLSSKGKEIAEAHEKAHGVLNSYNLAEVQDILNCVDVDLFLTGSNYEKEQVVYELVARMSQLKNYFGIKGVDRFTKGHLDYAREYYLKDITFNNRMDVFFEAITPEKEDKFLQIINSIAC
jgi:hypothetical protein